MVLWCFLAFLIHVKSPHVLHFLDCSIIFPSNSRAHGLKPKVKEAMLEQMEQTPFVYGGIGALICWFGTRIRWEPSTQDIFVHSWRCVFWFGSLSCTSLRGCFKICSLLGACSAIVSWEWHTTHGEYHVCLFFFRQRAGSRVLDDFIWLECIYI